MSKEAMKLALEAVKKVLIAHPEYTFTIKPVIKTLEEALAKQEQGEPVAWNDRKDEWTDEIAAHHPLKTKAYTQWDTAMAMVGARHSKGALVELVCWLLQKSTPQQRKPLTADDMKEPKNGSEWRVEWWNESCRMMLPSNKRLDCFQSYKNGTLQFTIKEAAHGIKE